MGEGLTVIVAMIAAVGAIVAASIAAHSARAARRANRVTELEQTIEQLHADRHQLWLYARELIDHIYKGKPPPPPQPPRGLFE